MCGLVGGLTLAAAPAHAVNYVKSVQYVEINLAASGGTSLQNSANLAVGTTTANCVPFVSLLTAGNDENFEQIHTDVYFEAGPKVTARRFLAGGTLDLGVYVVEFDSTYVAVQQNTTALNMSTTTATASITSVNTAKAALVFYYRTTSDSHKMHDNSVAGPFSAANQLS